MVTTIFKSPSAEKIRGRKQNNGEGNREIGKNAENVTDHKKNKEATNRKSY